MKILNKIESCKQWIIRTIIRSYWYNVRLERGWSYKRIKTPDLKLLEAYHIILTMQGWERETDIKANICNAWVWYKRKLNNT